MTNKFSSPKHLQYQTNMSSGVFMEEKYFLACDYVNLATRI